MSLRHWINQLGETTFFNAEGSVWSSLSDGSIIREKTVYPDGHTLLVQHNGRNRHGLAEIYSDEKQLMTVAVLDLDGHENEKLTGDAKNLFWIAKSYCNTQTEIVEATRYHVNEALSVPTL